MNKKIFTFLGLLCIAAAIIMKLVGSKSSHLSELKDFWWAPLPLAVIFILLGASKPTAK